MKKHQNIPMVQINWLMPIGWIAPIFHIHHFSLIFSMIRIRGVVFKYCITSIVYRMDKGK